jgi:hypothetical protein
MLTLMLDDPLQEKLSFVTWFMTRLLVMENVYDYVLM